MKPLKKIQWLFNRLEQMSLPEIGYRLRTRVYTAAQQAGFALQNDIHPPDTRISSNPWVMPRGGVTGSEYGRRAELLKEQGFTFFGDTICWDEMLSGWHTDPQSGICAPLTFGKTLDYRDHDLVGDIKYLWEPNRHLYLVAFAQAYYLTKEKKHLDSLASILDTWHTQNPYMQGPNWTSSLELGIRLINWSIAWQLIGGQQSDIFENSDGQALLATWLDTIFRHIDFIVNHFSQYSSANNHLIGEAAGVFVACVTWPFWKEVDKWREKGQKILVEEALKQNYSDGVNREQATSYQQFVLDFLLIAGLAGKANQIAFPQSYWDRIEAMLEFMAGCLDSAGNMPMFGDADDGYVVSLSTEDDFCPYRSLLATGAVLFKRVDFKKQSRALDHKTIWLLGEDAHKQYDEMKPAAQDRTSPCSFNKGGYYLLGKDLGSEREVRCLVDCGPLGYLSIAAHGHADALSFWLAVAGEEVFIDPGTFAYHTNLKWRNFFRGTFAHNTVRIDNQDQSVIGGNFMWTEKANTFCEVFESKPEKDKFCGYHDGYTRFKDPVIHRREIIFEKERMRILVMDHIECQRRHKVERCWHFSEKSRTRSDGNDFEIRNKRSTVHLKPLEDDSSTMLYCGNEELPMGWVSRSYDVKVPTCSAVFTDEIHGPSTLQTIIQIQMDNTNEN